MTFLEELDNIRARYEIMKPFLINEQLRKMYAISEVQVLGKRGAIKAVSQIMNIDADTISKGLKQYQSGEITPGKIRKPGGGRKALEDIDPTLTQNFLKIMDSSTCGDPCSELKWTNHSISKIVDALEKKGHVVSTMTIHKMLRLHGYSLQGNQKALEGNSQHPDRNKQFEYINIKVNEFQTLHEPVISIDTKKKELVGNFKNNGKEYHKSGEAPKVNVHDFEDKKLGKVNPYGVFDVLNNEGFVNVGIDKDTAQFATESIRRWWLHMGSARYPNANKLLITCDGGGSNSSRSRLWKKEVQQLANDLCIEIHVCHYPPGTSKWNKIEHSMFSYISQNWRGRPLVSYEVIVNLIASTTTKSGLNIECVLDENKYQTGLKVSDKELEDCNIIYHDELDKWNYIVSPKTDFNIL